MRAHVAHLAIVASLASICLGARPTTAGAQDIDIVGERVRVVLVDAARTEGIVVDWGARALSLRTDRDSV